ENDMRALYLPNAETWILEVNEIAIGFVALIGNEIGGLFLNPAYHGQGFGRALIDHAFRLKGPLKVEVFEKNKIGRRFYDGYGFIETERHLHEASSETVLTMSKN
ncbi:MAG: GNAT family N-acetyltransferase, partial [Sneathiella sp.]